jgi:hypothetical protein
VTPGLEAYLQILKSSDRLGIVDDDVEELVSPASQLKSLKDTILLPDVEEALAKVIIEAGKHRLHRTRVSFLACLVRTSKYMHSLSNIPASQFATPSPTR